LQEKRDHKRNGKEGSTVRVRELEPPDELAEEWSANLERLTRSAELLDAGGDAATAHDRGRFVAIATEARSLELEMAAFARRVGFNVCGMGV
jgi:hypothetical protein